MDRRACHADSSRTRHLELVKYWIKPNIENRIKNREIKAYFQSEVTEIRQEEVTLQTPEGPVTIKNDFVFAMIGYRPDLEFLASMGITLQTDTLKPLTNPDTLESERRGIYLAGVIVAGMHTNEIFIENGRFHGKKIAGSDRSGCCLITTDRTLSRLAALLGRIVDERRAFDCRRVRIPPL